MVKQTLWKVYSSCYTGAELHNERRACRSGDDAPEAGPLRESRNEASAVSPQSPICCGIGKTPRHAPKPSAEPP